MIKILFVCHGNICRSPMAEFIMKDLVNRKGIADLFLIESAATSTEEIGNPIYPPARKKLLEHGIGTPENELGVAAGRSRQVRRSDYDVYDYILCMDQYNLRNLRRMLGEDTQGKISMLLAHAGRPGQDVADPWYTGDFDATWYDVVAGCNGLLSELGFEDAE